LTLNRHFIVDVCVKSFALHAIDKKLRYINEVRSSFFLNAFARMSTSEVLPQGAGYGVGELFSASQVSNTDVQYHDDGQSSVRGIITYLLSIAEDIQGLDCSSVLLWWV
jgi:hypothetical protein